MVVVLESSDLGLLAVAKSLLENEGIQFEAFGEGVQDLLGAGRLGGRNIATGPARIAVQDDDAAKAQRLLEPLLAGGESK